MPFRSDIRFLYVSPWLDGTDGDDENRQVKKLFGGKTQLLSVIRNNGFILEESNHTGAYERYFIYLFFWLNGLSAF
jgi:hypothetical protein